MLLGERCHWTWTPREPTSVWSTPLPPLTFLPLGEPEPVAPETFRRALSQLASTGANGGTTEGH